MPRHKRTTTTNLTMELEEEEEEFNGRHGDKPGQRNAANARERARMRILSKAFSRLKTTLPWVPPDTKLSKLDTLRLATSYIAHLRTILMEDDNPPTVSHPLNLTWPFTLQHQSSDRQPPAKNSETWNPSEEAAHAGSDDLSNENSVAVAVAGFQENCDRFLDVPLDNSSRHYFLKNSIFSECELDCRSTSSDRFHAKCATILMQ